MTANSDLVLRGMALAPGLAMGRVHRVENGLPETPEYPVAAGQMLAELERLARAVATSHQQFQKARSLLPTAGSFARELACILDAHDMMVEDPLLMEGIRGLIRRGCNAEWAVHQYLDRMVQAFQAVEDPYLQEKQRDVEQVCKRILLNLMDHQATPLEGFAEATVLVATEFSPADVLLMTPRLVVGLAMEAGGPTSHAAIFAKSMGLPAVGGVAGLMERVRDGDLVILDAERGECRLNPSSRHIARYQARDAALRQRQEQLQAQLHRPAETLDGHRVVLKANIERGDEALQALAVAAEGVGLYRTDHLFFNRGAPLSEEEQLVAYGRVLMAMGGKPVAFRTMDLQQSRRGSVCDRNPAMGLRGVRHAMGEYRQPFVCQLRALLRLAAVGPAEILLPLVTGVAELEAILELLEQTRLDLLAAGVEAPAKRPRLGIMVEVPAAALCADQLAGMVDFFSIGTNDLVQYTLAVDREDEEVAHLYDPGHGAVLRLIGMTVAAGHRRGLPVAVCGEMAGDPRYALLLLGLGVDELSVSPVHVPMIRHVIRHVTLDQARQAADWALSQTRDVASGLALMLADVLPSTGEAAC